MWACLSVCLAAGPSLLLAQVPNTGVTPPAPARPAPVKPSEGGEGAARAGGTLAGNALIDKMNDDYVKVWRALMAPKNVSDAFGRRIAKRYIAMQLTIANRHDELQWLIQDASVDLEPLIANMEKQGTGCQPNLKLLLERAQYLENRGVGGAPYQVSSADLTVLRGVSEKGEIFHPRNFTIRLMTGAGTIASGLLGVTTFGPAFAPAVAAFNGPLISATQVAFPDFTVNQLNRLNDSAFMANTIVGKQQAKVIVVFIPIEYLLTKKQEGQYWKDPESVFGCVDLRLLEASVDGNFITTVVPTPVITAINIKTNEDALLGKDKFEVHGELVGRFLKDATVALSNPPEGVTIEKNGDASETRFPFVLKGAKPLMPGDSLDLEVTLGETEPVKTTFKVSYAPPAPTLVATALSPADLTVGTATAVKVTGTNFLPRDMQVLIEPMAGITLGPVTYVSNTEFRVEVTVAATAATGARAVRVSTKGGITNPATTLTIK
jgi:hypothetical protein